MRRKVVLKIKCQSEVRLYLRSKVSIPGLNHSRKRGCRCRHWPSHKGRLAKVKECFRGVVWSEDFTKIEDHLVVRPALLYGVECWPIKKCKGQRMTVAEKRMLHWMCGHTRLDRIRSAVIRDKIGVTPIEDKMRETRLKCFSHISRRSEDAPMRRC